MKKSSRASVSAQKPLITVGIDLGDRFSRYCIVNADGEVMEEGRIATTAAALERHFGGEARQRIALECGTHSPWVSRLGMGGQCAQATGDHRQRIEERSQRCGEAGAVCGLRSALAVADSASQSGTTTGPESAAS